MQEMFTNLIQKMLELITLSFLVQTKPVRSFLLNIFKHTNVNTSTKRSLSSDVSPKLKQVQSHKTFVLSSPTEIKSPKGTYRVTEQAIRWNSDEQSNDHENYCPNRYASLYRNVEELHSVSI